MAFNRRVLGWQCWAMTPPTLPGGTEDLDAVGIWLETNPTLVEKWLTERASTELRQRVQHAVSNNDQRLSISTSKRTSITSDLFQIWLAASPGKNEQHSQNVRPIRDLKSMEESELFMELIRDVANELDIDVLCHKILRNVSLLTKADRGSLFLARGPPDKRYLVAKLFDVQHDTALDEAIKMAKNEEIRIPFGVGIAGAVAQNKILVNIKDAYNVSTARGTVISVAFSYINFYIL